MGHALTKRGEFPTGLLTECGEFPACFGRGPLTAQNQPRQADRGA